MKKTIEISFTDASDEVSYGFDGVVNITRKNNTHLAFNRGIHMCLGIFLSRILAQETLKALIRLTGSIEISGTPVPFPSPSLNGPQNLPGCNRPSLI